MPFDVQKQCRECAFFVPDESGPKFKDDNAFLAGEPKRGFCRRFPKAEDVSALWGCGEHKPG